MRILVVIIVFAIADAAAAQAPLVKLDYKYGHDFRVRNVGAKAFDDTTPRVGVEFFHDAKTNALVAVSEAGHLAVTTMPASVQSAKADWLGAFELMTRPAGVAKFSEAKKTAGESFKDAATGKLLTVTNLKAVALADLAGQIEAGKDPTWHHALELKVRGADVSDFKSAKAIGVEAYRDGLSGGLIYVTETGFVAYAPAPASAPPSDGVKAPKAITGLVLSARKGDEKAFTKDTKAQAVEAFQDPNSGAILYLSETGSIAALPGGEVKKGAGIEWRHAFEVRPRKAGEKEFDKAAKYGVEVFEDLVNGAWVYVSENGSIAALRK
jgi:hypothetical protein